MSLVPRNINEAIKHLKPYSQEELVNRFKQLPAEEQLVEGLRHELLWLVNLAITEGVNIIVAIKQIRNGLSWVDDEAHKNSSYKKELEEIHKSLKNKKGEIRRALAGWSALDRLEFADVYDIKWLFNEITKNEHNLIRQEEQAKEFYDHEQDNPLYILKEIKHAFDYTEEQGFSTDYKVLSEKKYLITLSQNIYLTDEVEDIVIEDEQPIVFTTKITIDIPYLSSEYTFTAKYKDGAKIGYDEGSFNVDKKTMGVELDVNLGYILEDLIDNYDKFKKDILDLVETTHKESEQFDEEKYYPELQESIKHLTPKSKEEIKQATENLSYDEKLKVGIENNILELVKDAIKHKVNIDDVWNFGNEYGCINLYPLSYAIRNIASYEIVDLLYKLTKDPWAIFRGFKTAEYANNREWQKILINDKRINNWMEQSEVRMYKKALGIALEPSEE